jgi:hypothetical protein
VVETRHHPVVDAVKGVQGIVIAGIDLAAGMPHWWTAFEEPCCSSLGAILMVLQTRESGDSNQESGIRRQTKTHDRLTPDT